jgi:glycosyltransferase involved in cell wall biosynthesis
VNSVRFSVVITSYNQREFIRDALDSVLSQRTAELEVIVVDDGSTDGSPEILKQYEHEIQLVCLSANQGVCAARNRGASLSNGDYLAFLDGDDAFVPGAFGVYARIVQNKRPKMILGSMRWFKGDIPVGVQDVARREMQIVEYKDYFGKDRSFSNSASALVIDRESFQNVHGWSGDIFPMEDQDLTLRLGNAGSTVHILSPPTTFHRVHSRNTVNHVPPFLISMYGVIRGEGEGRYPGGDVRRRERRALIGSLVVFWTKRAVKAGLYLDAMKLFAHGWPLALAGVANKLGRLAKGRRPCETIAV